MVEEIDVGLVFAGGDVRSEIPELFAFGVIEIGDLILCSGVVVSIEVVDTDLEDMIGVTARAEHAHKTATMNDILIAFQISITHRLYPDEVKSRIANFVGEVR